ncbi:hypothetical protein G6O67_003387 [Ophiocordyceps sinensis]|uniref:Uncharacterized protein n=1 Tax=Ophiocordyceps sinensis TaxID=72228 RepID=A0A8H4PWD0_9HYPO|nr:hypothetical protein G6O67_003387 [Ophiocordyceps sinensis]
MASLLARLAKLRQGYSRLSGDFSRDSTESKHDLASPSEKPCPLAPSTGHHKLHHGGGPSALEGLTKKVMREIIAPLHQVDRVSLALVNRTMLRLLGGPSLQLPKSSRFELLSRLERDGVCPAYILCTQYRVFHPPGLFPASQRSSSNKSCYVSTVYLPPYLYFNMVAAVMRCHRHGWSKYSAEALSKSFRYEYFDESRYPRIVSTTQCQIVNGRLIAKNEILIFPCKGLAGLRDAKVKVDHLFHESAENHEVLQYRCSHMRWTEYKSRTSLLRDGRMWNPRPLSKDWGFLHRGRYRVFHCPGCYTSHALSAYDLPDDGGRVIAMTAWKDLGSGISIKDLRWISHLSSGSTLMGLSDEGLVANDFEEALTGRPAQPYHPTIDTAIIQYFMGDAPGPPLVL